MNTGRSNNDDKLLYYAKICGSEDVYCEAEGKASPKKEIIKTSKGRQRQSRIEERRQRDKIRKAKIYIIAFKILSVAMFAYTGVWMHWFFWKNYKTLCLHNTTLVNYFVIEIFSVNTSCNIKRNLLNIYLFL
jgi:hypothetical protein